MQGSRLADELRKVLGHSAVSTAQQDLASYAGDMYPRSQILKLGKRLPARTPQVVCFPETTEDVSRVMRLCSQERVPVVPYGAGSGVCGAATPEEGCVTLDLKRMNRILDFSKEQSTVTAQPGVIGEFLEEWLNGHGHTMGHFPSSIACSTVGGYVACRSAGQYSSRYGKIEDMTLGLEVVLPGGDVVSLGILGGGHPRDPMLSVILGSEGTMGIVTRACFRVEPLPDRVDFAGFAFLDVDDGLTCMRKVMQAGIRPTVLRLYDPLDTLLAGFHSKTADGEDIHRAAARFSGIKRTIASIATGIGDKGTAAALLRPSLLNHAVELLPTRSLLVAGVQGDKADVTRHWDEFRRIVAQIRGEDLGPEPGYAWVKRRYAVSYKQSRLYAAGAFVDTMEVATTWDNLLPLYRAVLKAMSRHVFIMAHFSHAYAAGCSIYFTFAGYRPTTRGALRTWQEAWKAGLEATARYEATISHHHGVGVLKKWLMDRETPGGKSLFGAFKKELDPMGIMNPGKLFSMD